MTHKDGNIMYMIVEFSDGLQIVPAKWLNNTKETCIWPSHFKTQLRINKAVITGEMPKERCDWQELEVKRIFGSASTYEKSMEKLILAQDTSNVDDTGISSDEMRERNKIRRRTKARKVSSSSSDEKDTEDLATNKENCPTQNKELPPFPQMKQFISSSTPLKEISKQHTKNISVNKFPKTFLNKDITNSRIQKRKEFVTTMDEHDDTKDLCANEFKKQVIGKLNKILNRTEAIENKVHQLENNIQFKDIDNGEECDIQFPLETLQDLNNFEELLQESQFKQKMLKTLKLVGGSDTHIMTSNILKKILANSLAVKFSWAGMKGKLTFKDLGLAKIIMQAVRLHGQYSQTTDAYFAKSISVWLAQATLRIQRESQRIQRREPEPV